MLGVGAMGLLKLKKHAEEYASLVMEELDAKIFVHLLYIEQNTNVD